MRTSVATVSVSAAIEINWLDYNVYVRARKYVRSVNAAYVICLVDAVRPV